MIKALKLNPADFEGMAYLHARRVVEAKDLPMQELEDIKQELLVRLIQVADRYKPEIASASTFAYTVLQNAAKSHLKRRRSYTADESLYEYERVDRRDRQRQTDMRLDAESIFPKIPFRDAKLLLQLRFGSIGEVAEDNFLTVPEVAEIRNRNREALLQLGLGPAEMYRKAVAV